MATELTCKDCDWNGSEKELNTVIVDNIKVMRCPNCNSEKIEELSQFNKNLKKALDFDPKIKS